MKTFFQITARLMLPGIAAGGVLSWISCMNELSSTMLLYGPRTTTMPIAVYTYVTRGEYGVAAALGTIMTVSIIIALTAVSTATKGKANII